MYFWYAIGSSTVEL